MAALSIDRIRCTVRHLLARLVSTRPRVRKCNLCEHLVGYPLTHCKKCPGRYSEPITWMVRLRMLKPNDRQAPYGWDLFADDLFREMGLKFDDSPRRAKLTELAIKICQDQVASK